MKANTIIIVLLSLICLFLITDKISDSFGGKKEAHDSESVSALIESFRKATDSHVRWLMMFEEQNDELRKKLHEQELK